MKTHFEETLGQPFAAEAGGQPGHDLALGELISQRRPLSPASVEKILAHQRQTGLRFGEAAVALGLSTYDDVLFALAQQFHYPYAPVDTRHVHPELVTAAEPFSWQAEAFRAIRSQMLLRAFGPDQPKRPLAVISPNRADGKTFFSANLAVALSQLGNRTLLVDADMRCPRQHEVFNLPNSLGLSGLLSGRAAQRVIHPIPHLPSLFLLPCGTQPPNPIELVERPAFSLLLRELVSKFDYVVVDTPAASHGADASAIALKCGVALCLARKGKSKVSNLQDLTGVVSAGSAKIVGVILNEH